jgi:hypothetical protein
LLLRHFFGEPGLLLGLQSCLLIQCGNLIVHIVIQFIHGMPGGQHRRLAAVKTVSLVQLSDWSFRQSMRPIHVVDWAIDRQLMAADKISSTRPEHDVLSGQVDGGEQASLVLVRQLGQDCLDLAEHGLERRGQLTTGLVEETSSLLAGRLALRERIQ